MQAFLTPNSSLFSSASIGRCVSCPGELWYLIDGAMQALTMPYNWEQFGTATPEETAEYFTDLLTSIGLCMPIGSITSFATSSVPAGYLLCDGTTYWAEDYEELYKVIHPNFHTFYSPPHTGAFKVPDLRDSFIMGTDILSNLASTGGESSHVLTVAEMPAHTHDYTPPVANVDLESPGAPDILAAGVGSQVQTTSTGDGNAHNNLPPYQVLFYGIKYQ